MIGETIRETLVAAWAAMEPLGVPMAIMGGIAITAWNRTRATRDVDVLVDLDEARVEQLIDRMKRSGFEPNRDPPVLHMDGVDLIPFRFSPPNTFVDIRVDVLLPRNPYHDQILRRRVKRTVPGTEVEWEIVASEDLVLLKLLADAAAVLRANRDLIDVAYLKEWAAKLDLRDPLAQVWEESFPGEAVWDQGE